LFVAVADDTLGFYQRRIMLYLNIWLTVKDAADVPKVSELLAEQARLSRQEPGCVRFEVYQSSNDPTRFLLTERWESQAALDAHRTAKAYTTVYHPQVLPLVNREPHPSKLVSG
jgi:quinol monooxygenase YgiN